MSRRTTISSGLLVLLLLGVPMPAKAGNVLTESSWWRSYLVWRTPLVRTPAGLEPTKAPNYIVNTPPPPAGWQAGDFADAGWQHFRVPAARAPGFDYGMKSSGHYGAALARQCLRARFSVPDPAEAAGLSLSLAYRGGVVVHVNGKELARAGLAGPATSQPDDNTLADEYPADVFVGADGKNINLRGAYGLAENKDRLDKRIRRLDKVAIPPAMLKAGVNVLAIDFIRSPYLGIGLEKEDIVNSMVPAWATCGPVSINLSADSGVSALPAPALPAIWASSAMLRITPADFPPPADANQPIRVVAARNGASLGKLTVCSDRDLVGVKAAVGDLAHSGGKGRIPAGNVKVLYSTRNDRMLHGHAAPHGGFFDPLLEAPPPEGKVVKTKDGRSGAIQPIVIKVAVPADAAPGRYEGRVTVSVAGGAAIETPLLVDVAEWKLPDAKDYAAHMGVIESPESVALEYKAPLWSDKHWKLVEDSFRLLGELGNRYVVLPLVCRTNLGNEQSMVRWVKDGKGGYAYNFNVFDRYLDIATKFRMPDVVCLYGWYNAEAGPLVTLLDSASGQASELQAPPFGTPQADEFWKPVYDGIKKRLDKRGLAAATMFGISGDGWNKRHIPTKPAVDTFRKFFPQARWVVNAHADWRSKDMFAMPVGYNTAVYIGMFLPPAEGAKRLYGWKSHTDIFPRFMGGATLNPMFPNSALGLHRVYVEAAFLANCSGLGRIGADFWPVLTGKAATTEKRSSTITARHPESSWDQLNMDTASESILAPGPDGVVGTERFEQIREGIIDAEARAFIEKTLSDPASAAKLDPALAKRLQRVLDERAYAVRAACIGRTDGFNWYAGGIGESLREKLFEAAAELAAAQAK